MTTLPTISQCALDVWLASGERSKERLYQLVDHYAKINAVAAYADYYKDAALKAVKPWHWDA